MRWWLAGVLSLLVSGCAAPDVIRAGDDAAPGPAGPSAPPGESSGEPPGQSPQPAPPAPWGPGAYAEPGMLELHLVGPPGQAAVLRLPDATVVLGAAGDAGADGDPVHATLARLGVATVDAVFVLGPGAWREGGCPTLFDAVGVGRLYHAGTARAGRPCLDAARSDGTPTLTALEVAPLQRLPVSAHATFTLLAANLLPAPDGVGHMVLRIDHGETSILVAGDLGCRGEAALLARAPPALLDVDVVLQGFPGGSDGGCPDWLRALTPAWVLVGQDPRVAPDGQVRLRLGQDGRTVMDTGVLGSDGIQVFQGAAPPAPDEAGSQEPGTDERPTQALVQITAIVHDEVEGAAAGTNEYAEVSNKGRQGIDISGWTVRNDHGAIYTFPPGSFLRGGGYFRIHTGHCEPDASNLCWGKPEEAWAGDGTAYLWDRSSLIHSFPYKAPPKP